MQPRGVDISMKKGMVDLKSVISVGGYFSLVPTPLELSRMSSMSKSRLNSSQTLEIFCSGCSKWKMYSSENFEITRTKSGFRMLKKCRPCGLDYYIQYKALYK